MKKRKQKGFEVWWVTSIPYSGLGIRGNDTDGPQDLMGIIGRFAIALMPEQAPFPVSWLVDLLNRPRQMAEDDKEEEGIKACR